MLIAIVTSILGAAQISDPGPSQAMWVYLEATGGDAMVESQPVVAPDVDLRTVQSILATGARLRRSSRWLNAISIDATEAQIAQIRRLFGVRSVERVRRGHLVSSRIAAPAEPALGPLKPDPWAMKITGIEHAHELGYTGAKVIIGVIDSGFSTAHDVFDGVQILAQHDFIQNDEVVADGAGDPIGQDDHGTQVLALLAGDAGDVFRGVAPHAAYVLAKTQAIDGSDADEDRFVAAVEWMAEKGVDVISSSVGFTDDDWPKGLDGNTTAATKIANAAASHGLVFVTAAGNLGPDPQTLAAPADGARVIAVGAVEQTLEVAGFSSRGPTANGRIKPDLVAPGAWLWSIDPNSTNKYVPVFGTSHATPLVAGAAALLVQARLQQDVDFDVQLVLRMTASQADQPDSTHGWGLLDLEGALKWVHGEAPSKHLGGCSIVPGDDAPGLLGLCTSFWICIFGIRRRRRLNRSILQNHGVSQ